MFPSLILREQPKIFSAAFPYNLETNPFTTKKQWPPDFTKLAPKHQFRLERRYRRRSKLKFIRPGWQRGTRLAQWVACLSVVGYAIFYMDWSDDAQARKPQEDPPFKALRNWYFGLADSLWSHSVRHPERVRGPPPEASSTSNAA